MAIIINPFERERGKLNEEIMKALAVEKGMVEGKSAWNSGTAAKVAYGKDCLLTPADLQEARDMMRKFTEGPTMIKQNSVEFENELKDSEKSDSLWGFGMKVIKDESLPNNVIKFVNDTGRVFSVYVLKDGQLYDLTKFAGSAETVREWAEVAMRSGR